MINKQVMKQLEHIDEHINSAFCALKALDLDTADDFDKLDILRELKTAANIVAELQQVLPTL